MSHPSYRADVDGLRAVAVLSVVAYHAFEPLVPGGFIGVDVFFVISGYLICGIIFAQAARNTLSLRDFYARRINRIFPALALTLVGCLTAGWFYLFADEFAELQRHVKASALFYANYTLLSEADYWDRASEFKPLLHLWSLAVEEQFYIFFPLLIYVLTRLRVNLVATIVVLLVGSFTLNVTRVYTSPLDSFYLPHRRFWELLLGGLLAQVQLAGLPRWLPAPGHRWRQWPIAHAGSVAGIALILGGATLMTRTIPFPGYWALVPTIGALLIIASGPDAWVNRVALSRKAVVWFGLISYPLYLWHWPLLSFLRIVRGGEAALAERILAVLLSILLAWLTYRFVERPIRSYRLRLRPAMVLAPLLLVVGIVGSTALPARDIGGDFVKLTARPRVPRWTPPTGLHMTGHARTAIFIGDSHANQYQPRISKLISTAPDRTRSAIFFATGSCLPIPNVKRASEPERACDEEVSVRHALAALSANKDIDTVVLSAAWSGQFEYPDLRYEEGSRIDYVTNSTGVTRILASLEAMIASQRREGRRVFIVLDNPRSPHDAVDAIVDPRRLVVRHLSGRLSLRPNVVRKDVILARQDPTRTWLVGVAQRSGATIIDPVEFLCPTTSCPVVTDNGDPVYSDGTHLSPSFVRDRVTYLDDVMLLEPQGKLPS